MDSDQISTAFADILNDIDSHEDLNFVDYHRWLSKIKLDDDIVRCFNKGSKSIKIHMAKSLTKERKSLSKFLIATMHSSVFFQRRSKKIQAIKIRRMLKRISDAFEQISSRNIFLVDRHFSQIKSNILATVEYYESKIIEEYNSIRMERINIDELKAAKKEVELLKQENSLLMEDNHNKQELINQTSKVISDIRGESIIVTLENLDTHFEILKEVSERTRSEYQNLQQMKQVLDDEIKKTLVEQQQCLEKYDHILDNISVRNQELHAVGNKVNQETDLLHKLRKEKRELQKEVKTLKLEVQHRDETIVKTKCDSERTTMNTIIALLSQDLMDRIKPSRNSHVKNKILQKRQNDMHCRIEQLIQLIQSKESSLEDHAFLCDLVYFQNRDLWNFINSYRLEIFNPVTRRHDMKTGVLNTYYDMSKDHSNRNRNR